MHGYFTVLFSTKLVQFFNFYTVSLNRISLKFKNISKDYVSISYVRTEELKVTEIFSMLVN